MLSFQRAWEGASKVGYGGGEPPRLLLPEWTWQNMRYLSSNPDWLIALVGLGPGMFGSFASTTYVTPFAVLIEQQFRAWSIVSTPNLYSQYLSLFGEVGILGLGLVIGLLVSAWKHSRRVFNTTDPFYRSVAAGAMTGVMILAARGAIAHVLEDRIIGFYAWLVIGMALQSLMANRQEPTGPRTTTFRQ